MVRIAVLRFLLSHRAIRTEAFSYQLQQFDTSVSVLGISYLTRILSDTFLARESHLRSCLPLGCV